jgi:hypothetical protein
LCKHEFRSYLEGSNPWLHAFSRYYFGVVIFQLSLWAGQDLQSAFAFNDSFCMGHSYFRAMLILIPSFLVFSIGWAMVASSEYRRKTPSPWHPCRSFFVVFNMLASSKTQPRVVKPSQNIEAVKAFNKAPAEQE